MGKVRLNHFLWNLKHYCLLMLYSEKHFNFSSSFHRTAFMKIIEQHVVSRYY